MDNQDPKSGPGNESKDSGSNQGSKPAAGGETAFDADEDSGTGENLRSGKGKQKGSKKRGFKVPHPALPGGPAEDEGAPGGASDSQPTSEAASAGTNSRGEAAAGAVAAGPADGTATPAPPPPAYPGPSPNPSATPSQGQGPGREYPGSASTAPPPAVLPPDDEALKGYPAGFGPPPYPYGENAGPTVPEQVSQWQASQQQWQGQIAPGYGIPVWMPPYGWVLVPYTGEAGAGGSDSPSAIQPSLPPGVFPPGAVPPGAIPPGALPPGAIPLSALPPGVLQAAKSNPNLSTQQAPVPTPQPIQEDAWVQTDESLPVFDENEPAAASPYIQPAAVEEPPQDSTRAVIQPGSPTGSKNPVAGAHKETLSESPVPLPQGEADVPAQGEADEPPQDSTRAVSTSGKISSPVRPFVTGSQDGSGELPLDATGKVSGSTSSSIARTVVPHIDPGDDTDSPPMSNSSKLRTPYVQPAKSMLGQEARDESRGAWGRHVYSEYEQQEDDDTPTDPFTTAHMPEVPDPAGGGRELPPVRRKRSLVKTMAVVTVGAVVATIGVGAITFPLWKQSLESAGVDLDHGVVGLLRIMKPEEERLLLSAEDAARAGDDWAAIEQSTKLIEKYPANAEGYMIRGKAEMQLRTFHRAVEDFMQVKRLAPANTMGRLLLAHCLVKVGEYVKATEECGEIENNLQSPVEERLYLHTMGLAKMRVKDASQVSQAVYFLEKASKFTPESAAIYSDYAESLLKTGNLQKAEAAADKAISLNPDLPEPYYIVGQVKLRNGREDDALEAFNEARKRRSQDIDYCIEWATIAAKKGQYTDALDALGDLEQSHPTDARLKRITNDIAAKLLDNAIARIKDKKKQGAEDFGAWTDYAYAKRKMRRLDDAYKATEVAILRNPKYGRAYLYRAQICSQMPGKAAQAVDDAGKALLEDPTLVNAYFTRAFALTDLKRYSEAIDDYKRFIREKHGGSADAEYNLGLCYHITRRFNDAIDHYSRAIEINPSNSQYYTVRADAHRQMGQIDAAIQDLKAAIAYDDKYPRAYKARADLFMVLNDYGRAAEDYVKYLHLNRNDAETMISAADALLKSGNPRDALQYCHDALDAVPNWSTPYLKGAECYVALNDDPAALMELNTGLPHAKRKGVMNNKKAEIYLNMRDYANASKFAATARQQSPEWSTPNLTLAIASLYKGDKQSATQDVAEYIKASNNPTDQLYGAIWEFVIQAKTSNDVYKARAQLKDRMNQIQSSDWPMALAKFLAGDLDKEAVLRDAKTSTRLTEAHTFIGLLDKLQSNAGSTAEFAWVKEQGDRNSLAYAVAVAELE